MFPKISAGLLSFSLLGFSFQPSNDRKTDAKTATGEHENRSITMEEARTALNKLIESNSFLADAPFLEPLKKRIKGENKKDPLLKTWTGSSAPGGNFIGPWGYDTKLNEFSYLAKSAGRQELYSIQGCFLLNEEKQWTAKVTESSVTKLTNFFGQPEFEKIQVGMTMKEVSKLLGAPPGAYFAGEMGFGYPNGRRANWPFTGTAKQFQQDCSWFFASKPGLKKKEWIERAWISNDIAIWITFDKDRKVHRKGSSEVKCPNEWFLGDFPKLELKEFQEELKLKTPKAPK